MTATQSRFLDPRYALTVLGMAGLIVTILIVGGGIFDLHDGKTLNQRGQGGSGPLWYPIVAAENPSGFKSVLIFRYVLPVVIFGTATLVCFLGAAAQPKRSHA